MAQDRHVKQDSGFYWKQGRKGTLKWKSEKFSKIGDWEGIRNRGKRNIWLIKIVGMITSQNAYITEDHFVGE